MQKEVKSVHVPESLSLPPVQAVFFLSAHLTAEDIEPLSSVLNVYKPHIIFPEGIGWSSEILSFYQQIAHGAISPDQAVREGYVSPTRSQYEYDLQRLKAFYNTQAEIRFIDIPQNHSWIDRRRRSIFEPYFPKIDIRQRIVYFRSASQNFEEELWHWRGYLQNYEKLFHERERYILNGFYPTIQEVLRQRPSLASEKPLRVCVLLGRGHNRLPNDLRVMGVDVSFVYASRPSGHYFHTAMNHIAFGRPVPELLLARSLLATMVEQVWVSDLRRISPNTEHHFRFITQKMRQLSLSQCEDLYKIFVDGSSILLCADRIDRFYASQGLGDSAIREFSEQFSAE